MHGVRLAQVQKRLASLLAVVVTIQVQLLVPEFTARHLLPYLPLCGQ